MDIPRPTLYRYLREYSIPHFKKSGKISIPEDSVERIRQARDLHSEGLGTGSVRRKLREVKNEAPDTGELAVRLDRLSKELEGLKGDPKALEEASSPHALRTILARQSLLMSAVFNLTEMVEGLLRANGAPPRRQPFEEELQGGTAELEEPETRLARSRQVGNSIRLSASGSSGSPASGRRTEREFGSLANRRRRGVVGAAAVLAACLIAVLLYSALSGGAAPETMENASQQTDSRRTIQVPDLSGLTYAEAETRLDEAGLAIEERESREGEVVGQNPEPDTEATEGDSVAVTLEDGGGSPDGGDQGSDGQSPGAAQYGDDVFEYTE